MAGYFKQHLDHEQLTNHDRPLGFHWNVPGLARDLGLRLPCGEAAVSSVLAEAILAAESGKAVSYSRNRNFYANSRRYRRTDYTYSSVLAAVAELDRAGLIVDRCVPPGHLGWQSSFVATDQLMQAWHSTARPLAYWHGEIIWLKDEAGDLIGYLDTRYTRRIRHDLTELNHSLAQVAIDLPGAECHGRHMVVQGSHILPIPGNPLRRIFSRGSWSLHGRAYGWWQSIPKTARASMTINGEPIAEVDYGSLHASILYNQAGIRFSGDAYDIDGFERAEIKLGFNIALNAKNGRAAVAALADRLACDRRHAADVITAIKRRHKAIERSFCSDAGVRLMRIDSELILTALQGVNDAGDPALPIHDALIVAARCASQAAEKMVESFEQIVGRVNPCSVKIKAGSVLHMGERG